MVYSAWDPDNPNSVEQNCASVDDRGRWNDVPCSSTFRAICYIGQLILIYLNSV